MSKVILGLSGGVDSAVSAAILKEQGHEVIGVFMRNWDSALNNDIKGNNELNNEICTSEEDWADVQAIAKQLDIEVLRVDFVKEYWDMVFQDLIDQYKAGRTPNPDILCNRYIKFGKFVEWVENNIEDWDYIAMGHYAKTEDGKLKKPLDQNKDQTYFLSQIKKELLPKIIFPLADIPKPQVREIAKKYDLVVQNKKDSTGICFIGERDFTEFLQNYIPAQPGDIIDITSGIKVGKHVGAMYYTIGQRKGLNLGGMPEPYYVAGHNLEKKEIYVAPQSNKSYLMSDSASLIEFNWLVDSPQDYKDLEAKFRYRSDSVKCEIEIKDNGVFVKYPDGFSAVTPGQQCVLYSGDVCLGGGIINEIFHNSQIKKYV